MSYYNTPGEIEDGAIEDPNARPKTPLKLADWIGGALFGAIAVLVIALLALCGLAAHGQTLPTTRPAVVHPKGIVSAWYLPPFENLATVRARGCNAVVGPELGNPPRVTAKQWCDEAARLGLGVIGNKNLLVAGYVPPNLIAWIVDDEPDSANHNVAPEVLRAQAEQFRALNPTVPVICNFAGDKLTSAGDKDLPRYLAYLAAVDVVWEDWYPINREFARYWGPTQNPPLKIKAMNFLRARGAKVIGSVVETSWQKLNKGDPRGRCPTPDEYEQEVNLALAAGASYIVHFSTCDSGAYGWPASYDPSPADVVARITSVNARLNPPVVVPPIPDVLTARVDVLEQRAIKAEASAARAEASLEDLKARLRAVFAATQPAQ